MDMKGFSLVLGHVEGSYTQIKHHPAKCVAFKVSGDGG